MNRSGGFLGSIPVVTRNLLIINLLCWLAEYVLYMKGINIIKYGGLHYVTSDYFYPHQIITYMFMHDPTGFSHIFFNMFAVFMFGRTLETVWGPRRFLLYYMITGIGAGLVQLLVTFIRINAVEADIPPNLVAEVYANGAALLDKGMNYTDQALGSLNVLINTGTVGASGAVFGILLAFGMLFPNAELIMIPIPIPIKAKYFVIGYGLLELGLGFANISGDTVAHFAHLGGLLFGLVLILYWKKTNKIHGRYY